VRIEGLSSKRTVSFPSKLTRLATALLVFIINALIDTYWSDERSSADSGSQKNDEKLHGDYFECGSD
jgi:hypothetical protein